MSCFNFLKNKLALVTGSTSGIGFGIAKQLASNGVHIAMTGIADKNSIEKHVEQLKQTYNVNCFHFDANLKNENEIKKMIENINEKMGKIDILINNAGIQVRFFFFCLIFFQKICFVAYIFN